MILLKLLVLFIIGAILGPLCDLFHSISHTSGYPFPKIYGLAWWVPLLFGTATVVLATSHVATDKLFKITRKTRPWREIVAGLLCFMFMYFASGFLVVSEKIKIVALAIMAFTVWYLFDKSLSGLILAFIVGICGSLVEIMIISTGHFYYNNPDFHGVPYWLPLLYIAASVSVGNLGRKLLIPPS